MVRSPDWDTDFFDIVLGVLQGDTFAPYFYTPPRSRTWNIHTSNKRKWFHIEKARKQMIRFKNNDRWYISKWPSISRKCTSPKESLLHSQEQVVGDINVYVNQKKTEFECFKRKVAIFTLSGKPLKLADQFIYFISKIQSTEINVNIGLVKAWNAINHMEARSSQYNKTRFLPSCSCVHTTISMHH